MFVLNLGTNVPYADEWEFVPVLTQHDAFGPWLWQQHNEHRLPLPRVIYYTLFRLTHDFRSGMVLQVIMLSTLAWTLLRSAARLRGHAHWADTFFPISLLHVGHWENLLMGYQICFVLFTILVMAIGSVALRITGERVYSCGIRAGGLNVMLCLCGGFGVLAAMPISLWLIGLAITVWRSSSLSRAALVLGLALFPFAYLGMYHLDYHRPAHHPPPGAASGSAVALVTSETLSIALGIGIEQVWPGVFAGLVVLAISTIMPLARSPNQISSWGLVCVASGVCGLALVIGIGRAGFGSDMGLWSRYALLTWPLLGLAYLVWVAQGGRGGKWIPALLCVASALAFPANTQVGIAAGVQVRQQQTGIASDAASGVPPANIVSRWLDGSGQEERALRGIPMLRNARIGPFSGN